MRNHLSNRAGGGTVKWFHNHETGTEVAIDTRNITLVKPKSSLQVAGQSVGSCGPGSSVRPTTNRRLVLGVLAFPLSHPSNHRSYGSSECRQTEPLLFRTGHVGSFCVMGTSVLAILQAGLVSAGGRIRGAGNQRPGPQDHGRKPRSWTGEHGPPGGSSPRRSSNISEPSTTPKGDISINNLSPIACEAIASAA